MGAQTLTGARAPAVRLLAVVLAVACKRTVPETPPPARSAAPPPVEVLKDGRWLFTYVEPDGKFATTDKPEAVPEVGRRIVRVTDPTKPVAGHLDATQVLVVDLAALMRDGKVTARTVPRDVFETAALAQLPPGRSSLRNARPAAPPAVDDGQDGGAAGSVPPGSPQVIVYGTVWCGACRSARAWLREEGIPFADKDVEQDQAAARELGEKAARAGVATDRVPILDVRGRLLVGFDPARVEALLGR